MPLSHEVNTIAAIATPPGDGGISVIRVSGEKAAEVVEKGFRGRAKLGESLSHTAHYGSFANEAGEALDYVVALVYKAPHSYTGENTVEISCHGGQYVTKRILESLIRFGARPAEPGEFTKRAFLNGRMDLVQAEAVADLIHSRSEKARQTSLAQLEGVLSKRVTEVRDRLVESIGLLELELDFAEDGYELVDKEKVASLLRGSLQKLDTLLATYSIGKVYRDGVRVALVGSPNVGKSSLLNALLREDRAIVTSIPGTTRDVIEESITVGGLLFCLSDTAGLRETEDPVEKEGVRRAEERLFGSDVVVIVVDGSKPNGQTESDLVLKTAQAAEESGIKCMIAINKIDLRPHDEREVENLKSLIPGHKVVTVSAKTMEGLNGLEAAMFEIATGGEASVRESGILVTNLRHYSALQRARDGLCNSLKTVESGGSSEFVAVDLRVALDALGEITGVVTTEDILNSIFSKFCIGK
jgi:tRNA modification GTPase